MSPTTVALWFSEPFPPQLPASIYFLALSHAPPEFDIITAKTKPLVVEPPSKPATPLGPSISPTTIGVISAIAAIITSSLNADLVHISTHAA